MLVLGSGILPELLDQGVELRTTWDFVFYTTFGFVITQSVNIAGVLMVFSVLVIPAVIAFLYSTSFRKVLIIAWGSGTVAIVSGLAISFLLDLATGPVLVLMFGDVLLVAVLLWPRFGVKARAESHHGLLVKAFEGGDAGLSSRTPPGWGSVAPGRPGP